MKMKSNPMLSLVALLLLVALLVTVCSGCGTTPAETEETKEPEEPKRFITSEKEVTGGMTARIITDTETDVQYLVVGVGYGAGVTVLQPASDKEDEAYATD